MQGFLCMRDLKHLCEVWDYETGDFLRSTFVYVDDDDHVWFGQAPGIRKYNLTIELVRESMKSVPEARVYPQERPGITTLQASDAGRYFIKRPRFACLDNQDEADFLPRLLLEEAEILELIEPHANIVRYFGCTVKNGRITGIALERYNMILYRRFKDDSRELDIETVMKGLRAAIDHLHRLGLAHNDVNPTNIALDDTDTPVLLDFGSCRKFGAQLLTAGNRSWVDEDYDSSSPTHDNTALLKLEEWLRKQHSDREMERKAKQDTD